MSNSSPKKVTEKKQQQRKLGSVIRILIFSDPSYEKEFNLDFNLFGGAEFQCVCKIPQQGGNNNIFDNDDINTEANNQRSQLNHWIDDPSINTEPFQMFLQKAEVLCITPFFSSTNQDLNSFILEMPNLQWIHSLSAGVDSFLQTILNNQRFKENPMPITNAKHAFSDSLAEYAIAASLYFLKQIPRLVGNQMRRKWDRFSPMLTLQNKTIGFIGFGSIAQQCLRLFRGFRCKEYLICRRTKTVPLGYDDRSGRIIDPYNSENRDNEFKDLNIKYCVESTVQPEVNDNGEVQNLEMIKDQKTSESQSKISDSTLAREYVFEHSDIILCTLPATPETTNYCNDMCFSIMKKGSIFINLGRGQVVEDEALIRHSWKMGGVALDVFKEEPLGEESKVWGIGVKKKDSGSDYDTSILNQSSKDSDQNSRTSSHLVDWLAPESNSSKINTNSKSSKSNSTNPPLPMPPPRNLLISPHNADLTADYIQRSMGIFAERYQEYYKGQSFSSVVDPKVGY